MYNSARGINNAVNTKIRQTIILIQIFNENTYQDDQISILWVNQIQNNSNQNWKRLREDEDTLVYWFVHFILNEFLDILFILIFLESSLNFWHIKTK